MSLVDTEYLTPHGILKFLQLVFGVIVMALTAGGRLAAFVIQVYYPGLRTVRTESRHWGAFNDDYYRAIMFCLVFTIVVIFPTIALCFAFLFKLYKIISKQILRILDLMFGVIATLAYFITFILLAVYCAYPKGKREYTNGLLVAACVVALATTVLYGLGAFFTGVALRKDTSESQTTPQAAKR